jgi:hypothetical protein
MHRSKAAREREITQLLLLVPVILQKKQRILLVLHLKQLPLLLPL